MTKQSGELGTPETVTGLIACVQRTALVYRNLENACNFVGVDHQRSVGKRDETWASWESYRNYARDLAETLDYLVANINRGQTPEVIATWLSEPQVLSGMCPDVKMSSSQPCPYRDAVGIALAIFRMPVTSDEARDLQAL